MAQVDLTPPLPHGGGTAVAVFLYRACLLAAVLLAILYLKRQSDDLNEAIQFTKSADKKFDNHEWRLGIAERDLSIHTKAIELLADQNRARPQGQRNYGIEQSK